MAIYFDGIAVAISDSIKGNYELLQQRIKENKLLFAGLIAVTLGVVILYMRRGK